MFEFCHNAREVVEVYRGYGFPVSCRFDRVLLVAAPALGAVVIPAKLGRVVRHRLIAEDAAPAVISHTRYGSAWIFPAVAGRGRGRPGSERSASQWEPAGVRVLDAGQRIWLPMTDHPTGWHWISQPVKGEALPSWTSVLDHVVDVRAATAGA